MAAFDFSKGMAKIIWKNVNINVFQIEAIEKLLLNPKLGKYNFKSVPDFISKAITFYIMHLERELEG